ncbi:MarR family transcriptional regulator [Kibdelosporangium persicum]|uniref:Serine/arginine repetitive matrix protein 1 n=1 Tax=Kibdelosporangium persicum TaxID=2698649 RepID=A0ABX2F347_9PSEU|nr:MarR family transcriptional regulator [Kibdelosporangium persicum]NRN65740.1 Serine/arginine repetitive matrix protein 1 [Kibdelosporangium persicum]
MSSKTRTRKTRTITTAASTTGSAPTLRSVPEQTVAAKVRTDTEDRLWEALHAAPNSTAADLSAAARIGKSTAQKILVKWAADGSVARTAGIAEGGRRAADLWAITEGDTTQADPTPVDTAAADDADTTDTTQAETVAPDAPDANDSAVTEEDPVEQTDTAVDGAQDPADSDEADPVEAEPVVAEVNDPTAANGADGATTDGDTTTENGADATGEKKARLAPGGLRGMVEDYLRDHPGEEFGPTAIANALGGKSSGAVSNALDKLVEGGVAARTQDKPRRFALALAEQEAAPAPTN